MNRRDFLRRTPLAVAVVTAPVATLALAHTMDAEAIQANDREIRAPFRNGDAISVDPFNRKFAAIADELQRLRGGV